MATTLQQPPDTQKTAPAPVKTVAPTPKLVVSKQVFTDFAAI